MGGTKFIFQHYRTSTSRLKGGMAGGGEGVIVDKNERKFIDARLKSTRLSGEIHIPFTLGVENVLTFGGGVE